MIGVDESISLYVAYVRKLLLISWTKDVIFVHLGSLLTWDMTETVGSLSVYKWLTFVSMYIGYTLVVFNRKSFIFALPAIIASVGLGKDDAGEMLADVKTSTNGAKQYQIQMPGPEMTYCYFV